VVELSATQAQHLMHARPDGAHGREQWGLPPGITLRGRAHAEGSLIDFGFALVQDLKARKAPEFK